MTTDTEPAGTCTTPDVEIIDALITLTKHGLLEWRGEPGAINRRACASITALVAFIEQRESEQVTIKYGAPLENHVHCPIQCLLGELVFKPRGFCKECNEVMGGQANYWGVCPECHKTDGMLNIGRSHWYYCTTHKTRWCIGENLLSCWRSQTEEEQRTIYEQLRFDTFANVEPHHCV